MQDRNAAQRLLIAEILNTLHLEKFTATQDDFLIHTHLLDEQIILPEPLILEIYHQITLLRVLIDESHSIRSRLITLKNGTKAYVRYAELDMFIDAEFNEKKIAVYNYLRIFYAYLLAAIVISRIYQFDHADYLKEIYHIKKITTDIFCANVKTADDELMFRYLAEGKGYLVNLIHIFYGDLDIVTINYMIDRAKDWVALDEPSVPVCTLIQTNEEYSNKIIVIIDEPCSKLTSEQTALFSYLKAQSWFKELSNFEQKLVMYYKNQMLTGTSVIPSRLRGMVPLNKNAFQESIWIAASPDEFELINTCYHAGTVAHVSHKDKTVAANITRLNMLQQKFVCHADAMVMICLNSQKADSYLGVYEWMNGREFVADDSEIIKLTEAAALQLIENSIFYGKICLNGFRVIEYNDYSGIDSIIAIINKNLIQFDQAIPCVSRLIKLIVKLSNLQTQFTIVDYHVKGLDIIHLLTQIASANNQMVEAFPGKDLKNVAVWFGCASGENRTGIAYYHNICASIIDYFKETTQSLLSDKRKQQIFEMIAKSQHLLVMTGYQGNTFGTDGIRSKSSGSLKEYHPKLQLITKTSDVRVIPAYDASFNAILHRLPVAIQRGEMNAEFKKLIPLVKEYLHHAKNQQPHIVFFPKQIRDIYTEMAYALVNILILPFKPSLLNILMVTQKSLLSILNQNDKRWDDSLVGLGLLLDKMIIEVKQIASLNMSSILLSDDASEPRQNKPSTSLSFS